MTRSKCK